MELFGGLFGLIIALLIFLWATGLMKPVRRIADVASDSVERAANMADREMKKLDAKHANKTIKELANIDVNTEAYAKAKTNLEAIRAFEL